MCTPNTHPDYSLSERIPASLVSSSWKHLAAVQGILLTLFCLTLAIVQALSDGWRSALLGMSIFGIPAALFLTALILAKHHQLVTNLPTVELRADHLVVHYGNRKLIAKLSECHCHFGRAYHMRLVWGGRLYSRRPVILIDLPPRQSLWSLNLRPSNIVAVGYTDEMRQKWERALHASMDPPPPI